MRARYHPGVGLSSMVDPQSPLWSDAVVTQVPLSETPMGMQPTDAVRAQWQGREYGKTGHVRLAALHNGSFLAFRLQWHDPVEDREIVDNDQFTDAAAVMLPSVPGAPILLMGSAEAPVNAWYWRADEGAVGRHIVATGIGTTRTVDRELVVCNQQWHAGEWTVIIARPMLVDSQEPVSQLRPGEHMPYGIAVWAGSNQERAGIKSFTLSREDLFIDQVDG